jgi:hypothetical protein
LPWLCRPESPPREIEEEEGGGVRERGRGREGREGVSERKREGGREREQ